MLRARALDILPHVTDLAGASVDCLVVLNEAQTVPVAVPVFVDEIEALPDRSLDIIGRTEAHIDPVYLTKLHDVVLLGDRHVVTQDGVHLVDLWNQAGLHTTAPTATAPGGDVHFVSQTCLLLFHNASSGDNHSHWLLQTLPQLGLCARLGIRPDLLLVQPNIRPYQRDVLAALGYGPECLLVRDPRQAMRFRCLFVGYVDGGLVPDPYVFDRQIAAFDRGQPGPEKLYVSRQDARGIRRLLNEGDLIGRLRGQGFTIVEPSTLSAAEEVSLFRNARLIVGPLGAGLYNALFTRPGAMIVALSDPRYVMDWLPQAAALRGHAHAWCFGLGFEAYDSVYAGTHGNWIVDVERVGSIVARL